MKSLRSSIFFILFNVVFNLSNISCSSKSSKVADAAITPSESSVSNEDSKTLSRIVNSDGSVATSNESKKKKAAPKRITKVAPAPKKVETVAASVPVEPKVEAPKVIEANPDLGGFFSNHWPLALMTGMMGLGSFFFFAFWRRREEKQ